MEYLPAISTQNTAFFHLAEHMFWGEGQWWRPTEIQTPKQEVKQSSTNSLVANHLRHQLV